MSLTGLEGSSWQLIVTTAATISTTVLAATAVLLLYPSTIKLNFLLSALENVLTALLLLSAHSPPDS